MAPFPLETNRFFSGWELSEVKKGSLTGEGVGIAARSPGLPQDRPVSGFSDVIDVEGFIVRLAFSRLVDQNQIGENSVFREGQRGWQTFATLLEKKTFGLVVDAGNHAPSKKTSEKLMGRMIIPFEKIYPAISPHKIFCLLQDGFYCQGLFIRRIIVFYQDPFHHNPHLCLHILFYRPVNRHVLFNTQKMVRRISGYAEVPTLHTGWVDRSITIMSTGS
ncbi:MAG: hypothetical protein WC295_12875 [Methanoregula sp.]